MIHHFIDIDYREVPRTYCRVHIGHFTSLIDATANCNRESSCSGIYDKGCDGGTFFLCDIAYSYESEESTNDCVYDKLGRSEFIFFVFIDLYVIFQSNIEMVKYNQLIFFSFQIDHVNDG